MCRDSQRRDLATSTLALSSRLGSEPNRKAGKSRSRIAFSAPSQGYAESMGDVLQEKGTVAYPSPSPKRERSQGYELLRTSRLRRTPPIEPSRASTNTFTHSKAACATLAHILSLRQYLTLYTILFDTSMLRSHRCLLSSHPQPEIHLTGARL